MNPFKVDLSASLEPKNLQIFQFPFPIACLSEVRNQNSGLEQALVLE